MVVDRPPLSFAAATTANRRWGPPAAAGLATDDAADLRVMRPPRMSARKGRGGTHHRARVFRGQHLTAVSGCAMTQCALPRVQGLSLRSLDDVEAG